MTVLMHARRIGKSTSSPMFRIYLDVIDADGKDITPIGEGIIKCWSKDEVRARVLRMHAAYKKAHNIRINWSI